MKRRCLPVAMLVFGLLAPGAATVGARAAADTATPFMINCEDSHLEGSRLEVSCYNPDFEPGTVDLMYACSTPLDFDRPILVNEPRHVIGAGATLRLTRDCGDQQVVVTYQLWPITRDQQADEDTRMAQIRERRDRETPR